MNKVDTEIVSGNKLIAEFMGGFYAKDKWRKEDDVIEVYNEDAFDMDRTSLHGITNNKRKGRKFVKKIRVIHLLYHSSWDWLMPVGAKITSINIPSDSEGFIYMAAVFAAVKQFDIMALWNEIVEFIKWYKTQAL